MVYCRTSNLETWIGDATSAVQLGFRCAVGYGRLPKTSGYKRRLTRRPSEISHKAWLTYFDFFARMRSAQILAKYGAMVSLPASIE